MPTLSTVNSIGILPSHPHRGLRRDFRLKGQKSITLSVGTPLCPCGNAYRRVYGLSPPGLFKQSLCRLLGGQPAKGVSFLPPLGRCTLVIPMLPNSQRQCRASACATYCTPCLPLLRAVSGWILSPPLTFQSQRHGKNLGGKPAHGGQIAKGPLGPLGLIQFRQSRTPGGFVERASTRQNRLRGGVQVCEGVSLSPPLGSCTPVIPTRVY